MSIHLLSIVVSWVTLLLPTYLLFLWVILTVAIEHSVSLFLAPLAGSMILRRHDYNQIYIIKIRTSTKIVFQHKFYWLGRAVLFVSNAVIGQFSSYKPLYWSRENLLLIGFSCIHYFYFILQLLMSHNNKVIIWKKNQSIKWVEKTFTIPKPIIANTYFSG